MPPYWVWSSSLPLVILRACVCACACVCVCVCVCVSQLLFPLDKEMVVATTRVETMLGDTAVAVNPQDSRYKVGNDKPACSLSLLLLTPPCLLSCNSTSTSHFLFAPFRLAGLGREVLPPSVLRSQVAHRCRRHGGCGLRYGRRENHPRPRSQRLRLRSPARPPLRGDDGRQRGDHGRVPPVSSE